MVRHVVAARLGTAEGGRHMHALHDIPTAAARLGTARHKQLAAALPHGAALAEHSAAWPCVQPSGLSAGGGVVAEDRHA